MADSLTFSIVLCPDPLISSLVTYSRGETGLKQSTDEVTNGANVEVLMCPEGRGCTDLNVSVSLCPEGEECLCKYTATEIEWRDNSSCRIYVSWRNPDKCALKVVQLKTRSGFDSSFQLVYQHSAPSADPLTLIYPDGDERNPPCPGCGMGGDDQHPHGTEEISFTQNLTPGQVYRISGYFNDLSCGGVDQEIVLGYLIYETTGWSSGRIAELLDEATRLYRVTVFNVNSDGELVIENHRAYASDWYDWQVDDVVMLAKYDTEFPGTKIYGDEDVTNDNVASFIRGNNPDPKKINEWTIVAYNRINS